MLRKSACAEPSAGPRSATAPRCASTPFGPGDESLRKAIARHALRMGCHVDADDVIVTSSCLESITLCLRTVARPGDVVALESPTYCGFLEILESLGLRALEIPTHLRTGLSLDALQLALDTQPVKAILAVPTLSNPLGASMPLAERKRLAQMLARHQVPLIEDVLYNDLCEEDDRRRAVQSFDTGGQVMLQRALADLLTQPGIEAGYRQLRAVVAARMDEARAVISRHFPKGTRMTSPAGGYILWLELPGEVDTEALFHTCLEERICIAPGSLFSTNDRFRRCVRLGLGGKWGEAERRALARVGRLATELMAEATATRTQ